MLDRLVAALRGSVGSGAATVLARTDEPDGDDADAGRAGDADAPRMYVCVKCDTTYIGRELERCSTCGEAVHPTLEEDYTRDVFV